MSSTDIDGSPLLILTGHSARILMYGLIDPASHSDESDPTASSQYADAYRRIKNFLVEYKTWKKSQ